jgi:hypothetical protein
MTYISLTKKRAKEMNLKYFIKKGTEVKEVTLEEYWHAVPKFSKESGNVPKFFMGNGMTGYIAGEDEEKLV